jgi:hypothetical protein
MLDVGWAWDAVGRGLALGKTPPRWGNGSNFEGLGGEDASATGEKWGGALIQGACGTLRYRRGTLWGPLRMWFGSLIVIEILSLHPW